MSLSQLRNVNFGRTRLNATGSSGVGYQILDTVGSVVSPRTTSGVYQTAPGIYAAYVTFPDNFRGQLLWDTGATFPTASYATEQYNVEENNPNVDAVLDTLHDITGTLNSIYDIQFGRWRIVGNQMIFFKEDNATEVARFDLFDDAGNPTMDAVFERTRV
jgi:hypothetical protein